MSEADRFVVEAWLARLGHPIGYLQLAVTALPAIAFGGELYHIGRMFRAMSGMFCRGPWPFLDGAVACGLLSMLIAMVFCLGHGLLTRSHQQLQELVAGGCLEIDFLLRELDRET